MGLAIETLVDNVQVHIVLEPHYHHYQDIVEIILKLEHTTQMIIMRVMEQSLE
jgi:hypothetical protein